jgi:caa(3)-type oxidase subunit IV
MSTDKVDVGHMEVKHYVYLWVLLLALLISSLFAGMLTNPLLGHILIWGVAILKTFIVAAYYMHMKVEQRFIRWAFYFGLFCVVCFISGTYMDVVLRTN